jgi:hypothetical protein
VKMRRRLKSYFRRIEREKTVQWTVSERPGCRAGTTSLPDGLISMRGSIACPDSVAYRECGSGEMVWGGSAGSVCIALSGDGE